jgi:hypothetical protein
VQLLQGAPPCNHHSVACCKPDDTSHFTAHTYFATTRIPNITSNSTRLSLHATTASKQETRQASLVAKLSSARALLTVASASRPAQFPVTRSFTKESPEPHFCLREPPCRPCNNVRAPTGRSSSQQQSILTLQSAPYYYRPGLLQRPRPTSKHLESSAQPLPRPPQQPPGRLDTSGPPELSTSFARQSQPQQSCLPHTATFTTSVATPAAYTRHCPYATCSQARPQEMEQASVAVIWRVFP